MAVVFQRDGEALSADSHQHVTLLLGCGGDRAATAGAAGSVVRRAGGKGERHGNERRLPPGRNACGVAWEWGA